MNTCVRLLVCCAVALLTASVPAAPVASTTLANGDQVQFDGAYYDFRAADGKKMIKLWVPPAAKPIRGLLITGHGGGGGDSRQFARDVNFRAFAVRHGFAVVGLHNFPGREVYDKGSPVFFGALNEFAKLGKHPELANVPFVVFGGSNGGAFSYGLACSAPSRAICFTPNASAWFNPETPTDSMIKVPGLFVVGVFDPFMRGVGVETVRKQVAAARARGGRWSMIAEEKGHEDGATWQIFSRYWDRCIALRLPADADPSKGPVVLRDIPEDSGWLVDPTSWKSGLTTVAPFASYTGDKSVAGWVPDADIAWLYRAVATYDNPIVLSSPDLAKAFNADTDYRSRLVGVADPALAPGATVRLQCDTRALGPWTKIEFYDGARKLGEVKQGKKAEYRLIVDRKQRVYNISVLGYRPDGTMRAATPVYFYVSDPSLALFNSAELTVPTFDVASRTLSGSTTATRAPLPAFNDSDSVLVAYGLSADQEKTWNGTDGKLSAFWSTLDTLHDSISLTQKRNGSGGNNFSAVLTNDARLAVKACHTAAGLYLLLVATDNRFVAVEDTNHYLDYDAVDMLIDSRSSRDLCKADVKKSFVCLAWGLSLTTRQYQSAYGDTAPPAMLKRNGPTPWDMVYGFVTRTAARAQYGIEVDHAVIDKYTKAQEWFIPWSEVGNGGMAREPAAGVRIGFSPGYNDRDHGEQLVGQSDGLRWIGASSPWGASAEGGKCPLNWGDIEMGPMAGRR